MKKFLLTLWLLFGITGISNASTWTWTDGNFNIHTYTVVTDKLTWDEAYDSLPSDSYLATITSQEEQNAMFSGLAAFSGEYWLGGKQNSGSGVGADENWGWMDTGESFGYTYWEEGEPNDWNGLDEIHLGTWSRYDWKWNDEHGSANIKGYIFETGLAYDPSTPVPEPGTMMLLGFGLLGLSGVIRRKNTKKN